jgi:hypothetical protein
MRNVLRFAVLLPIGAIVSACSAPAQIGGLGAVPQMQAGHARALLSKSWMKPAASSDDLVYVSNADGEVTVYDYATQALVGVLAAFETPRGECVDRSGNIYIADAGTDEIYEYAHGGTKAIKTLDDSPNEPNECSVDPTTGNLAVANLEGGSSKQGSIALYARASGKPTLYIDASIGSFAGCAYDDKGSLLTSGHEGSSNASLFAWLPPHGSALVNINVPGPKSGWMWFGISGIQWDGQFFALDDGGDGVYQVALIHGQPYWVSQTQFDNRYAGSAEYGIYDPNPKRQGKEILVGFNDESYSSGVDYYPYPAGGESGPTFTHGIDDPFAISISLAK